VVEGIGGDNVFDRLPRFIATLKRKQAEYPVLRDFGGDGRRRRRFQLFENDQRLVVGGREVKIFRPLQPVLRSRAGTRQDQARGASNDHQKAQAPGCHISFPRGS